MRSNKIVSMVTLQDFTPQDKNPQRQDTHAPPTPSYLPPRVRQITPQIRFIHVRFSKLLLQIPNYCLHLFCGGKTTLLFNHEALLKPPNILHHTYTGMYERACCSRNAARHPGQNGIQDVERGGTRAKRLHASFYLTGAGCVR